MIWYDLLSIYKIKRTPKSGQSKGGKIGIPNVWKSLLRPQLRQAGPATLEPATQVSRSSVWLAFPLLLADTFTDSSKEMESSSWISSSVTIWPIVGSLVSVLAVLCSQRSPGSFTPPLLEPAAGSSGDPSPPLCFVPAETRSRRQQFSSTKNAMLTATELTFTVPGQNSQDQQNILRYCVRNLHLPASIRLWCKNMTNAHLGPPPLYNLKRA